VGAEWTVALTGANDDNSYSPVFHAVVRSRRRLLLLLLLLAAPI